MERWQAHFKWVFTLGLHHISTPKYLIRKEITKKANQYRRCGAIFLSRISNFVQRELKQVVKIFKSRLKPLLMNVLEIPMQLFSTCLTKTSLLSKIYTFLKTTVSNQIFLKEILNQILPLVTFLDTYTFQCHVALILLKFQIVIPRVIRLENSFWANDVIQKTFNTRNNSWIISASQIVLRSGF